MFIIFCIALLSACSGNVIWGEKKNINDTGYWLLSNPPKRVNPVGDFMHTVGKKDFSVNGNYNSQNGVGVGIGVNWKGKRSVETQRYAATKV